MLRKSFLIALILVFLAFKLPGLTQSSENAPGLILGGSLNAPVRIEVFSDFQCPACRELYLRTIGPFLRDYAGRGKVCVIYYEFPLQMHQYSREAARYCEAAYRLGDKKFILVMDALFRNQTQWDQNGDVQGTVAQALSPRDFRKLQTLLKDPGIDRSINKGIELGDARNVRSTPTIFIYSIGRERKEEGKAEGFLAFAALEQYVDRILR